MKEKIKSYKTAATALFSLGVCSLPLLIMQLTQMAFAVANMNDLTTTVTDGIGQFELMLTKIALALIPLCIIGIAIVALFNHDARSMKQWIAGLVAVIAVGVVILLVNNGAFKQIIGSFTGDATAIEQIESQTVGTPTT